MVMPNTTGEGVPRNPSDPNAQRSEFDPNAPGLPRNPTAAAHTKENSPETFRRAFWGGVMVLGGAALIPLVAHAVSKSGETPSGPDQNSPAQMQSEPRTIEPLGGPGQTIPELLNPQPHLFDSPVQPTETLPGLSGPLGTFDPEAGLEPVNPTTIPPLESE